MSHFSHAVHTASTFLLVCAAFVGISFSHQIHDDIRAVSVPVTTGEEKDDQGWG
ncbi:hypothetical protein [Streptomyces sp. NPDC098101]|uniref:hypothetical protein n=1 Tax=Streptomyces sp. NPDC098101 TaxID=3366096 RepID=UPI003819CDAF